MRLNNSENTQGNCKGINQGEAVLCQGMLIIEPCWDCPAVPKHRIIESIIKVGKTTVTAVTAACFSTENSNSGTFSLPTICSRFSRLVMHHVGSFLLFWWKFNRFPL